MENAEIADIFNTIADLLELKDANEFRIRSYRSAARTVRGLPDRIEDLAGEGKDLAELPNIGDSTAEKIREILNKGTCKRLEDLRKEMPEGLTQIMRVPGLGARKAMTLNRELGVTGLDELQQACEDQKVRDVEGFGARTEKKILEGIATARSNEGRILYKDAADHVESLGRHLDGCDHVKRWQVAGSFRRAKETVGDLDVLIEATDRQAAADELTGYRDIAKVDSRGQEKVTVHLGSGLQVDFRFFEPARFGSAMLYFTGSKAHNIALRRRAQGHDWKLNEYGLSKGENLLAGADEESVYHRLDLPWIAPELREDRGEIDAAERDELPDLIEAADVRGDLQSHTTASDGTAGIEEMAQAAAERGLKYLAITDHTKRVTMANGLDNDGCRQHADAIRKVNDDTDGLWLLAGIEVDILKSGKLDLDEDVLAGLDWVIASIHYDRDLGEKKMTERMLSGIRSGVVHGIAHPLGRIIGGREPMAFDFGKVVEACADNDVLLEINAQPDRLDLPDTYVQQARQAGVRFSLGTDAHKPAELDLMPYGVNMARRGWLEKADVVNTLTLKQLAKALKRD